VQQRIRVWFRKGERQRFISHLDTLRYWERCLRRAELPLAYSQGFTPHPKLAFAGPLPLGFTAENEVMDVTLDERVPIDAFTGRLSAQTTEDLEVTRAEEIPLSTPPPQAAVLWADYTVELPGVPFEAAERRVDEFLALPEFPWTEERHERSRTYDLRATVAGLTVAAGACGARLFMRLESTQQMTSRPEQVVSALFPGVESGLISRTGLVIEESSPAREAWRRRGRFSE
jgi:radical SAM-linked protein